MTLNPIAFGVLMTIVAEIVLVIIGAIINVARNKGEEEDGGLLMSEEEFRDVIMAAIRESVDEVVREKMSGDDGAEEQR